MVSEEDRGRGMTQPMRGDLPYPEGSTGGPQPQIERPAGNGAPEYLVNTNCDAAKAIPPGAWIRRPLNFSWRGLPLEERCTQASGNGHILEDASLALDPESDDFLPHPLAI